MSTENKPYVIVVGVDYSDISDLALNRAFELASQRPRAEVHIVNVVRTYGGNSYLELRGTLAVISLDEASDRLRAHVEQKLDEYAKLVVEQSKNGRDARAPIFERAVTHVCVDSPAEEIAQLASDLEADLVVVGTHGYRGMRRLLLGSVAESVVRLSPAPVLVVRPKQLDTENIPQIQPPCPRCVETRRASAGKELWCEQHNQRHGRRHTYFQIDRNSSSHENMPLFVRER
jgi:nucleotide-binding universal stress UspA family protein